MYRIKDVQRTLKEHIVYTITDKFQKTVTFNNEFYEKTDFIRIDPVQMLDINREICALAEKFTASLSRGADIKTTNDCQQIINNSFILATLFIEEKRRYV